MRRCGRCGGAMFVERDEFGYRLNCLLCGRGVDLIATASLYGSGDGFMRANGTLYPCPRCQTLLPQKITSWLYCSACGPLSPSRTADRPSIAVS